LVFTTRFFIEGRAEARWDGILEFLLPVETRQFDLEIQVIEGDEEIKALKRVRGRFPF